MSLSAIPFVDPNHFVAGQLPRRLSQWNEILDKNAPVYSQVIDWIANGVDIPSYFKHFNGKFWGI